MSSLLTSSNYYSTMIRVQLR